LPKKIEVMETSRILMKLVKNSKLLGNEDENGQDSLIPMEPTRKIFANENRNKILMKFAKK